MIGSPDLRAFTSPEEFGENGVEQNPPEELLVPVLSSSHPWERKTLFHRDFILVAEFSEQVGPKPVLTIPDDQRVIGSFDLNHFSVRIMSVDYQASGPGHTPPTSPGPRLNFSEDSKVILGDSAEDAFAYVHHVTLYDLEARGMVRPFCMAYVCSDQTKLLENFCELSEGFSQASESLKTGNRQAFSVELRRKLQELEYRRITLLQEDGQRGKTNGCTEGRGKSDELESVEWTILNHRELLRQVTSYPNRKLKQPDFLPYDPADSLTDASAFHPPEPSASYPCSSSPPTATPGRTERSLKPLQELCNDYFLCLMKEQLTDTERHLRGDRSDVKSARVTRALSRKLRLTNFLFEPWGPEDADDDEGEGAGPGAQGVEDIGRNVEEVPLQTSQAPESFFSCVGELPIKLERGETGSPDRTEMTGSVSSSDSIEVLGTERSYKSQQGIAAADQTDTSAGSRVDVGFRLPLVDFGVRRVQAYAKRANSEDSIEVLSTTESIVPDDLTAITEEEVDESPLTNGFNKEEPQHDEGQSELNPQSSAASGDEEAGDEAAASDNEEAASGEIAGVTKQRDEGDESKKRREEETAPDKMCMVLQAEKAVDAVTQWPELRQKEKLIPDLRIIVAPPTTTTLAVLEPGLSPRRPLRLLSVDEVSDCTSFTNSSDPPSPTQTELRNLRLDKSRSSRRKAGLRALRFIRQHSFSQHAVFCLLSGRPLVVVGANENSLRKMVDALSLFLPAPGAHGSAVMPCLTMPIRLTDLLTWRLMGIQSSSSSTLQSVTRYSRYIALLDLDQKTLKSPSYCGSLLGPLTNPHTGISRGITFLLHLESCLTALGSKVLLHTFCRATSNTAAAGDEGGVLLTRGCCSDDSDFKVMNFLSDLLKLHHVGRGPPALRFSYSSVQLHRNTSSE